MIRFQGTFDEAAEELARRIERSVSEALGEEDLVAVAFSGGLDSSVIAACAVKKVEVLACSAFMDGSLDSRRARESADALGVRFLSNTMGEEDVARELKGMSLPFEASAMDRSLWALYSAVARKAGEGGARVMLLGQLADELFGGYAKYERCLQSGGAEKANEMMEGDVREYPFRGRQRDVAACSRWVEPRFPYESEVIVELGMSIPIEYKIGPGGRKLVLREAAKILGVPEAIASAPKKAAQYSSGVQRSAAVAHAFIRGEETAPHDTSPTA